MHGDAYLTGDVKKTRPSVVSQDKRSLHVHINSDRMRGQIQISFVLACLRVYGHPEKVKHRGIRTVPEIGRDPSERRYERERGGGKHNSSIDDDTTDETSIATMNFQMKNRPIVPKPSITAVIFLVLYRKAHL